MADATALLHELDHYRQRWSDADSFVSQRLTILISILAGAVAASAALLSGAESATEDSTHNILGAIWLILSVVSEGIFLRLVRVRHQTCCHIEVIYQLREQYIEQYGHGDTRETLTKAYLLDSVPPEPFSPWSSPSAAILVQGFSLFAGISYFTSAGVPWTLAIGLVVGLLAGAINVYHFKEKSCGVVKLLDGHGRTCRPIKVSKLHERIRTFVSLRVDPIDIKITT